MTTTTLSTQSKSLPPALPAWPLIGNMWEFSKDRHQLLERGYKALGPIFSFKLATKPVAVLIGPEYHQFFFTETDKTLSIDKPYNNLAALFGKVAFLASHADYLEQHPILYAPFRPEKMGRYVNIMQREVQKWIDSLGGSGTVEISEAMGKLVQEVAGYALMGEDFQQKMGREFWELYADLGKTLSFITPPHWPTPNNLRRDRAIKRMNEMLLPVIAERRRNREAYDDFLQDFVNTRLRSGTEADSDTISGLLRALMFASHETTAGQSAWTIIEILRHADYRSKMQAEIDAKLPFGTVMDGKSMRGLEHVLWAVREIERLHPSADMLMRVTNQEVEVGDYRIPAGWLVMVAAGIAHQSDKLFSQPEQFDPLRFAPDRAEDRQHGYALIGFGGGRHKCAGMNFANNEMMVITSLLFQQMEMELLTPDPKVFYGLGAGRPEATLIRYKRKL